MTVFSRSLLLLVLATVLFTSVLPGCAGVGREKAMIETLDAYRQVLRWGQFEQALEFVAPEFLEANPYTALDMERYAQVAISSYRDGDPVLGEDGKLRQSVGISLYNRHTLVERNLVDRQVWRYDSEAKRWWLETGLPDITRAR